MSGGTYGWQGDTLEFPAGVDSTHATGASPPGRARIRYNDVSKELEVSIDAQAYEPLAGGPGQDIIAYGTGLAIAAGGTAQPGGSSFTREDNTIPDIMVWPSTSPTGLSNFWVPSQQSPFDTTEVAALFAYFARGAGSPGDSYAALIENRWSTDYVNQDIPIVVDWMIVAWRLPS